MSRVLVLVEGPTERAVVQKVFAPYLGARGIDIHARVVGRPGHKGGVRRSFQPVIRELTALLKQEPGSIVTTFFDYYAMPPEWPGVRDANGLSPTRIPQVIEPALHGVITSEFGNSYNPVRFIPYVQMHELEALLFSDPAVMALAFENEHLEESFRRIVQACGGCELINNSYETAPSKRIEALYPAYKKGSSDLAHAPIIADLIGIDRMRQECPHFNEWFTRLEGLGHHN